MFSVEDIFKCIFTLKIKKELNFDVHIVCQTLIVPGYGNHINTNNSGINLNKITNITF